MKVHCCLLVLALAAATLPAQEEPGAVVQFMRQRGDAPVGEVTVGELLRLMARVSVERQETAYVPW